MRGTGGAAPPRTSRRGSPGVDSSSHAHRPDSRTAPPRRVVELGLAVSIAMVTGSGGLIGSQCVRHFLGRGFDVVGLDNDLRSHFFGASASTEPVSRRLTDEYRDFRWLRTDVRDAEAVMRVFAAGKSRIELVIHTAAQPSHDLA